ncbi:MAG TPA: DUF3208 family protein [Deinococcales bacterium]|nr:DUF3208 family protein [Deinococcales bacterium]
MTEQREGSAIKLLQGYLWHPRDAEPPALPAALPGGFSLALDEVPAPFAFFDNGEPAANQAFYQLTVLEVYPETPDNETLHRRANQASLELDPILNATDRSVGWSLSEDLRPA